MRFSLCNTGGEVGEEVAQIYLRASNRAGGASVQAPRNLVQFERVALAQGERRDVTLHVAPRTISLWSAGDRDWRLAGGWREVYVGSSSRDIRLQGWVRLGP